MRTAWFIAALISAVSVAVMQQLALANNLYWRFVWFDLPVHFLGGLTIAILTIAFLMRRRVGVYVGVLLAIFIGWEVFEVLIGSPQEANYFFDTSLDILMDTLGAVLAYVVARFTIWRSK